MAAPKNFRQFPASLLKTTSFVKLSPTAKATYFVLRGQLYSYGIGQCVPATLPHLVNCSQAELDAALGELTDAGMLERDDAEGIYWLRGAEQHQTMNPSYKEFISNTLDQLPENSPVVRACREYLCEHGVYTVSTQKEKEQEREEQREQQKEREQRESLSDSESSRRILEKGALREDQPPRRDIPTRHAAVLNQDGSKPRYATIAEQPYASSRKIGNNMSAVGDAAGAERDAATVPPCDDLDDDLPF